MLRCQGELGHRRGEEHVIQKCLLRQRHSEGSQINDGDWNHDLSLENQQRDAQHLRLKQVYFRF